MASVTTINPTKADRNQGVTVIGSGLKPRVRLRLLVDGVVDVNNSKFRASAEGEFRIGYLVPTDAAYKIYKLRIQSSPVTAKVWVDEGTEMLLTVAVPLPPPPEVVATQTIIDGSTISGKVTWLVTFTGEQPHRVDMLIDGVIKWPEVQAEWGGILDTETLTNGSHIFSINAYKSDNTLLVTSKVTATVNNIITPPPTPVLPPAPTGLTALGGNQKVDLSWGVVSLATSYKIYRDNTLIGTSTAPSYTSTGLTNEQTYSFKVSAVNTVGEGPFSSSVSATPRSSTVSTSIYGVGIGMDTLANTTLGGPGPIKSFMRFRSPYTSSLKGFTVYFLSASSPAGYGGGTGGTKRFTIQTDDGTGNHYPTGTVIATQNVAADAQSTANYYVAFSNPPTLNVGTLYHLVCENTDNNPNSNYFALDYAWSISHGAQWHPRFPNSDWAHGYWDDNNWVTRTAYAPVLDLNFTAGHYGMGYMEVSLYNYGTIDGTAKVREQFTVSGGTRTINSVGIRLVRGSGSSPLTLTLKNSGGSTVATASIPASSIQVGTPASGQGDEAIYAEAPMSATITNGSTYYLECSTSSGTTYYAWAIRKGVAWGYNSATYFADGVAEKTSNGSTWTSVGNVEDENDLQFFFRV